MYKVKAGLYDQEKGNQIKKDGLKRILESLNDASEGLEEILIKYTKKAEGKTKINLENIRTQVTQLRVKVADLKLEDEIAETLTEDTQSILNCFSLLSDDLRSDKTMIDIDTAIIIAHANVRRLFVISGRVAISNLGGVPVYKGWRVDKEITRILNEFEFRYPRLFGYKITTSSTMHDILIELKDLFPGSNRETKILDELKPLLKEFLIEELRQNPLSFVFEIYQYASSKPILACVLRMPDIDKDNYSSFIIL